MANLTVNYSPYKGPIPKGANIIFEKSEEVGETLSNILRYYDLTRIPAFSRAKKLTDVQKIWVETREILKKRELSEEDLAQIRRKVEALGGQVSSIYLPEITRGLDDKMMQFEKDPNRIAAAPFKKASLGSKGPTILVSYPVENGSREFVIKYLTSSLEPIANRVYHAFLRCFSKDEEPRSLGAFVPLTTRFDFENALHETPHKSFQLKPEVSAPLQKNLARLAKTVDAEPVLQHVMITERVAGKNLLEFFSVDFTKFDENQKNKLFERIGRLAIVDFFFGYEDRFIRILNKSGKYQLDPESECNLGNLMVELNPNEKSGFLLHAIDNEINPDPEYSQFFLALFNDKNFLNDLIKNLLKCFETGLRNQADEMESAEKREPLQALSKNLAKYEEALHKGMSYSVKLLQNDFAVSWEKSELAIGLKAYLNENAKDLLEAIDERLSKLKEKK